MTWETYRAVQQQTLCEFEPRLAGRHHFVRLLSGRWTRTLGLPADVTDAVGRCIRVVHVRGKVWHQQLPA